LAQLVPNGAEAILPVCAQQPEEEPQHQDDLPHLKQEEIILVTHAPLAPALVGSFSGLLLFATRAGEAPSRLLGLVQWMPT
jgi:hypothetical protein